MRFSLFSSPSGLSRFVSPDTISQDFIDLLQVMDPKMDSGCLAPGESLDDDYDVTRPLLPAEVVGIIDQLLSLEVSHFRRYAF